MRVYLVATILCLAAAVCTATEPEKRSDSELSRGLIGSWEGKLRGKDYPVTKAFVSFNSNGALKWVEIMEFLGYYGRREYEGKWHVTNGILISQITGSFGISYVDRDRIASVQDSVLILRSEDGDENEFRKAPMPTQFPPLLPPHAMEKLVVGKPTPDYPIDARRNRLEGTGLFKLFINEKTGTVSSVRILKSTGYKILDEAAIRGLKNWRFRPETVYRIVVPIRFQLRHRFAGLSPHMLRANASMMTGSRGPQAGDNLHSHA
jgi:TonB family protein